MALHAKNTSFSLPEVFFVWALSIRDFFGSFVIIKEVVEDCFNTHLYASSEGLALCSRSLYNEGVI